MQRKSTNSISLIKASGISPSKPWCVGPSMSGWTWPGLACVGPTALWDRGQGQMDLVPEPPLISFSLSPAHKKHRDTRAEGRIWQPGKLNITAGSHMAACITLGNSIVACKVMQHQPLLVISTQNMNILSFQRNYTVILTGEITFFKVQEAV